jgi:hypothetical protein
MEEFFTEITQKRIRRGTPPSVAALEQAIEVLGISQTQRSVFRMDGVILGRLETVCEQTLIHDTRKSPTVC